MSPPDSPPTSLHALSVNNSRFAKLNDTHKSVTLHKDHHEYLTECAKNLATDPCAELKSF
ncbi:uncharacterized protein FTOL_06173 [Fusarium torulosum]|uniref:Uncharacterized protein n=1 Tax=Fusarium torulosum TaxID=33205 RepID=A0AAE8SHV5_9HYPO|nr:uncharacterized protein FTOL_06173 [Fusarium torulosum]